MSAHAPDVIVVGGGPGGYPAAIRLADEGLRVVVIEEGMLGGECTNYGCVPSKALLRAARIATGYRGYKWAEVSVDGTGVLEWARGVAASVRGGLERLLDSRGVEIIRDSVVSVRGKCARLSCGREVCARRAVLVATGSKPRSVPGISIDNRLVLDNRGMFSLDAVPESIIVIGGGYVGVEASYALASLGSRVTLLELMPRLLPGLEREASLAALRSLKSAGVAVYTRARVKGASVSVSGVRVRFSVNGVEKTVEAEKALVAVGREPRLPRGIEFAGPGNGGFLRTDCHMRVAPGIYAAGDVTGPPLLAHKAMLESIIAAENILGREACKPSYLPIPEVVYIRPEIARVAPPPGFRGTLVRIRVEAIARSRIEGEGGLASLYIDNEGRIRGGLLIFEGAAETVGLLVQLAREAAKLESLETLVLPHPTMSEALAEAVHYSLGKPIHITSGIKKVIG